MAAKRPPISKSRMIATVASSITQMRPSPNFAPASPEVAKAPTSRNPPVAVMMPSTIESHFFMTHPPSQTPRSHGSVLQLAHANHTMHPGMDCLPPALPIYRDREDAEEHVYREHLVERVRSNRGH